MRTFCIILALCLLTFISRSQPACQFTLGSQNFDLCAFTTVFTLDTVIDGTLSFSLATAAVPSCSNAAVFVWSKLQDGYGDCFDVADQDPVYTLLDSTNAISGGLSIKYPVNMSPAGTEGFQLVFNLHCAPGQTNMADQDFKLIKMFGQASTDVTTYTISGSSDYACAVYTGCPPQMIGTANFKLCDLNTTSVFNLTDPLGGHLAFNLGGTPLVQGCSWPHESDYIFGNYYANSGACYSATSTVSPTYTPLNYYIPTVGILVEYHYPYSTMQNLIVQIKLKLYCDPSLTSVSQIQPTVDVTYVEWYLTFDLTAASAYACPV